MAKHLTAIIVASTLWTMAGPVQARPSERPITEREIDAEDIAKTPVTDLNLTRTEIPALLIEAEKRPYSLQNIDSCKELIVAVKELDEVLGLDIDLPRAERARFNTGRLAQWAVGTFIPFRTLIREISGANRQQREIAEAIQVGLARRGFLKGVGSARNCPYPGSPATEAIIAQHAAAIEQEDADKRDASKREGNPKEESPKPEQTTKDGVDTAKAKPARTGPVFTSEPVVQPIH